MHDKAKKRRNSAEDERWPGVEVKFVDVIEKKAISFVRIGMGNVERKFCE